MLIERKRSRQCLTVFHCDSIAHLNQEVQPYWPTKLCWCSSCTTQARGLSPGLTASNIKAQAVGPVKPKSGLDDGDMPGLSLSPENPIFAAFTTFPHSCALQTGFLRPGILWTEFLHLCAPGILQTNQTTFPHYSKTWFPCWYQTIFTIFLVCFMFTPGT